MVLLSHSHTKSSMHSCPLSLSLKGTKVGQAATEPALAPTGDSNLLGNPSLLLMGVMMESEGDSSIPRSLQHSVLQAALIGAVVPLGQVRGAVGAVGRRPDLVPVHTAATLDLVMGVTGGGLIQREELLQLPK